MSSKRKKCSIAQIDKTDSINKSKLDGIDYPVFCFKHLQDASIKSCKDPDFFVEFLQRLKKLCELGWKEISISPRHSFGIEKIDIDQIIPTNRPAIMTPDVTSLTIFRATGNNHS
ncbi:MAG: hypothetical protein LBN71_07565, partial [Tannerella sp.]|nr:hypothetical protein [Tannerella sp.]